MNSATIISLIGMFLAGLVAFGSLAGFFWRAHSTIIKQITDAGLKAAEWRQEFTDKTTEWREEHTRGETEWREAHLKETTDWRVTNEQRLTKIESDISNATPPANSSGS